jgi:hypothetical protein
MTHEHKTYVYEVFITHLAESGQKAMVQIFRDPDTHTVLHAQLAFENSQGTWGVPYQLDQR